MQLLHHDPKVLSHKVRPRPGKIIQEDFRRRRARFFEPDSQQWWRKGKAPLRDSFRQRCYDVEIAFTNKVEQKKFSNITEVAKYIRWFMEKPWFQRRFPFFECCTVEYKKSIKSCSGGPRGLSIDQREVLLGNITLANWGMGSDDSRGGEIVVLHEFAHAVLPGDHNHDRRWVRTFLEFIGCAMGQDVKRIFMIEFRKKHIPFNPVKKVDTTPEQIQRLAAARP